MSTPAGTYFDGNYSKPVQHGPAVPWVDQKTRSQLYKITYHQAAHTFGSVTSSASRPFGSAKFYYKMADWGTRGPNNAVLVEETEPRDTGTAGIIEFDRIFAHVPKSRVEFESYVFQVQISQGGDLVEFPMPTTSALRYEYFYTKKPEDIPVIIAPKLIKFGGSVYWAGGRTPAVGELTAPWIVAEDSQLERWRGDIWQRVTRKVRTRSVTLL